MSKVYMMVTITNRNKRKDFQTFFKEYGLPVFLETIGRGTAQSEVLDYFGLEESENDVISCNRYRRDVEKAAPGTDHEDADRCTRDRGIVHCAA